MIGAEDESSIDQYNLYWAAYNANGEMDTLGLPLFFKKKESFENSIQSNSFPAHGLLIESTQVPLLRPGMQLVTVPTF